LTLDTNYENCWEDALQRNLGLSINYSKFPSTSKVDSYLKTKLLFAQTHAKRRQKFAKEENLANMRLKNIHEKTKVLIETKKLKRK
jgi:hypothetical protein